MVKVEIRKDEKKKMDNITLGQIFDGIIRLSVVAGAVIALYKLILKGVGNLLTPIKVDLKDEKMSRLKSELTTFMFLAENGNLSPEQKILAHEDYDEYIKNKGNSYIHDKFESLVKEGKI